MSSEINMSEILTHILPKPSDEIIENRFSEEAHAADCAKCKQCNGKCETGQCKRTP